MSYYNPYSELCGGKWQKCNFHGHTEQLFDFDTFTLTDLGYENLAKNYKSAGFDAICNSHKTRWIDYSDLAERLGISIFPGQEHVVEYDGIVLVGTKQYYDCSPQEAVDACIRDGGFCYVAHPNQNVDLKFPGIPGSYPYEVIDGLTGITGIEIYNGCLPNREYNGIPFGNAIATDVWDKQLSQGKKYWGFGSDDAHEAYEINTGWVEIYARSNSFEDIKEAVFAGRFCVCRGLRMQSFSLINDEINIRVDHTFMPVDDIAFRFVKENGEIVKESRGKDASYKLNGEHYVRIEAHADDGSVLWTQPIMDKEFFGIK